MKLNPFRFVANAIERGRKQLDVNKLLSAKTNKESTMMH